MLHYIPEDRLLHNHHCENHISYNLILTDNYVQEQSSFYIVQSLVKSEIYYVEDHCLLRCDVCSLVDTDVFEETAAKLYGEEE
jgi:hypothetical protein